MTATADTPIDRSVRRLIADRSRQGLGPAPMDLTVATVAAIISSTQERQTPLLHPKKVA